jgi:uncharacterized protein (TIGR02284 family)
MKTKDSLTSETIGHLNDLLQLNVDSENGFNEAAEQLKEKSIVGLFIQLANQRKQNAIELQSCVSSQGEEPANEGSFVAALHRAWLQVRSLLSGGDTHAILSEAERGEDAIKGAYEEAIRVIKNGEVYSMISRQYSQVKAGHDKVKLLRDTFAKKS